MNTILILNKLTFELIEERKLVGNSFKVQNINENDYSDIINLLKDLDQLNTLTKSSDDCITMKLETGKTICFRKSKTSNIAVAIFSENKKFKRQSLMLMSEILLNNIEYNESSKNVTFKTKEFLLESIEELTLSFIDYLRTNKLFLKFIYLNYNPNASNSIYYKKTKIESNNSVILFNTNGKESDKDKEPKDTILQKSTIKEKELNIELEKKQNKPTKKKIFITKFNNIKTEQLKKKTFSKGFNSTFFIDKYFLNKTMMIHMLFNNVFIETSNDGNNSLKDNYNYPINNDNDHVLLFLLDMYDKAQQMFSVNNNGVKEYVDICNYIELNFSKPEIVLIKNKLVFVKFKALFIAMDLEIYEDKNYWCVINSNTNFYKEIEHLFSLVYFEEYGNGNYEGDKENN